jgi:hypothetical protein
MSIPARTHSCVCSRHFFSSRLRGSSQADEIPLGIGEVRYDEFAFRIFRRTHHALTAEAFSLLECGFDAWNADVENCVAVICRPPPTPPGIPTPSGVALRSMNP